MRLALEICRTALDAPELTAADIPVYARFDVRRDVEYVEDRPQWAAPQGARWERSGTGELEPSEYDGTEVYVYRWDIYGVSLPELETLAELNLWEGEYGLEPLGGYLDYDGLKPAVSVLSDGMDWNQGGYTPVRLATDYVVLS